MLVHLSTFYHPTPSCPYSHAGTETETETKIETAERRKKTETGARTKTETKTGTERGKRERESARQDTSSGCASTCLEWRCQRKRARETESERKTAARQMKMGLVVA